MSPTPLNRELMRITFAVAQHKVGAVLALLSDAVSELDFAVVKEVPFHKNKPKETTEPASSPAPATSPSNQKQKKPAMTRSEARFLVKKAAAEIVSLLRSYRGADVPVSRLYKIASDLGIAQNTTYGMIGRLMESKRIKRTSVGRYVLGPAEVGVSKKAAPKQAKVAANALANGHAKTNGRGGYRPGSGRKPNDASKLNDGRKLTDARKFDETGPQMIVRLLKEHGSLTGSQLSDFGEKAGRSRNGVIVEFAKLKRAGIMKMEKQENGPPIYSLTGAS